MPLMHGSPSGKSSIIVPRYETGLRIEIAFLFKQAYARTSQVRFTGPVPLMNHSTVLELSAFLALALKPHYIEFDKADTIE